MLLQSLKNFIYCFHVLNNHTLDHKKITMAMGIEKLYLFYTPECNVNNSFSLALHTFVSLNSRVNK